NQAPGASSVVPGGDSNFAGAQYSFASGRRAKIRTPAQAGNLNGDLGSFVWADSTNADFNTGGANEFRVRAGGGVVFNSTTTPGTAADMIVGVRSGGDNDADLFLLTTLNSRSGDFWLRDSDSTFELSTFPTGANFLAASNGASLTTGGAWTNAS